jgi:hypothetical protein
MSEMKRMDKDQNLIITIAKVFHSLSLLSSHAASNPYQFSIFSSRAITLEIIHRLRLTTLSHFHIALIKYLRIRRNVAPEGANQKFHLSVGFFWLFRVK